MISVDTTPRHQVEMKIHEQLIEAGKILGIKILDLIIISKKGYYTFQDNGLLN